MVNFRKRFCDDDPFYEPPERLDLNAFHAGLTAAGEAGKKRKTPTREEGKLSRKDWFMANECRLLENKLNPSACKSIPAQCRQF